MAFFIASRNAWLGKKMIHGEERRKFFSVHKYGAREAERRARQWEGVQTLDAWAAPLTRTVSVGEWFNAYLDHSQRYLAPMVYREKRDTIRRFSAAMGLLGNMDVAALQERDFQPYMDAQAASRTGNAANKDRKNMAAAWAWAQKRRLETGQPMIPAGRNPFREMLKAPEERNDRYVPPLEDFQRVYDLAEGQDKVMLMAYLHLGARKSELFRLLWSDVDLPNRRVALKTRKLAGRGWKVDILRLTEELAEALREWRATTHHPFKAHVFTVQNDAGGFGCQYSGEAFKSRQHWMRSLCGRAGIKPFGLHGVRHLCAVEVFKAGKPVWVIQQILRHESPLTTIKYLRSLGLNPEVDAAVDEVFGGGRLLPMTKKVAPAGASGEG